MGAGNEYGYLQPLTQGPFANLIMYVAPVSASPVTAGAAARLREAGSGYNFPQGDTGTRMDPNGGSPRSQCRPSYLSHRGCGML